MTITVDGTVVENVDVKGTITIEANNVTIRNFRVDGEWSRWYGIHVPPGVSGVLIEDGEIIHTKSAGLYGEGLTARRLNIHDVGTDAMKLAHNSLVEASWFHHLGLNAEAHADGCQTRFGSNIVLRGNFFDMPIDIGGGYKSNAASINDAALGPMSHFVLDGNWLNGGNYTLYLSARKGYPFTDIQVTNNRFGRDYRHGVLSMRGDVSDYTVDGNVWDDNDEWMDINDTY